MEAAAIKMAVKDFKIILLVVVFMVLSVEMTSGATIKSSEFVNRNYCRNHIFHPRCRGQQKRDVMSHLNEDYRLAPLENGDIATLINSPTLLGELLRKAIDTSHEYDSETGNYLN